MEKCYNEWRESLRSYEREKRFQTPLSPKPQIVTTAQIQNQQRAFNPILQVYESPSDEKYAVEMEEKKAKSVYNRYKTYPALQRQPAYNIITIANYPHCREINTPRKNTTHRKHGYDESIEGAALWNSLSREANTKPTTKESKTCQETPNANVNTIQRKCRATNSAKYQSYNVITHEGYENRVSVRDSEDLLSRRKRYALRYELERLKREREDRQFDLCAKARAKMVLYPDVSRNRNYDIITHVVKPTYIFNRVAS